MAFALLLVVALGVLVSAVVRYDERTAQRERAAVKQAVDNHVAVMKEAVAAAESESSTLGDLVRRDLEEVHRQFGGPLHERFGYEYVYITDSAGKLLYSSEDGQAGGQARFAGLKPALERLSAARGRDGVGLAKENGQATLLVLHVFERTNEDLGHPQPLRVYVGDVVDAALLKDLSAPARLDGLKLAEKGAEAGRDAVAIPNLADGSNAFLVWRSEQPGRRILAEIAMPLSSVALLACALLFILMRRAQRTAAKLVIKEAEARELAQCDRLTGLANRAHFVTELEEALRPPARQDKLALLFIDLDGFKDINDTSGHAAGDALLQVVARRFKGCIGEAGRAARFGGDEFVLFLRFEDVEELEALVSRIFDAINIPIQVEGELLRVSASVGAAYAPRDGDNASELMRRADIALYRAKAEGRDTFRLFEPRFEQEQLERRRTEQELAAALEKGELRLLYQPQVDVESERIVGFEALVRWDHPKRGRIGPEEFIAIAESSRLIRALDAFVLRTACREGQALPGVTLSVNMSPIDLRYAGVVQEIEATLAETGFDPNRLEFEITESAIIDASPEVMDALFALRAIGVRLALDDFGTGHASLVHVRRFPITKIKIDKSFILNLGIQRDAASIVEYVVRLGRSLGITLTAEGVETREQLRFLRAFGAHHAQGYLFGPPLPIEAAVALLEKQRGAERAGPSHPERRPQLQATDHRDISWI